MSDDEPARPPRAAGRDLPRPTPSDLEATQVFHASQAILPPPGDYADMLEELEEDAIVGQASALHELKPLTEVAVEHRRVVISELPPRDIEDAEDATSALASDAPYRQRRRQAVRERRISEPTLVMRDRRQLEELRRQLLKDRDGLLRSRAAWMWGAVLIFVLTSLTLTAVLFARRDRAMLDELRAKRSASGAVTIVSESEAGRDSFGGAPPEGQALEEGAPAQATPGGPAAHRRSGSGAAAARGEPSQREERREKPVDLKELPLER